MNSIDKINKKDDEYTEYDIIIDKRIKYNSDNINIVGHHIFPYGYELIPNLTIKWTIEWLLLQKEKDNNNYYGIIIDNKNKKIRINKNTLLYFYGKDSIKTHNSLHDFLDRQKIALFYKLGAEKDLKKIFKIKNKKILRSYADRKKYVTKNKDFINNKINVINNELINIKSKNITALKELKDIIKKDDFMLLLSNLENYIKKGLTIKNKEDKEVYFALFRKILNKINGSFISTFQSGIKTYLLSDNYIKTLIKNNINNIEKRYNKNTISKLFSFGLKQSIDKSLIIIKNGKIIFGFEILKAIINTKEIQIQNEIIKINDLKIRICNIEDLTKVKDKHKKIINEINLLNSISIIKNNNNNK